ncbi:MAG TPA: hypothetical protein VMF60_09815, partial [Acidimicrobiales bacterium]|nr:hypothetical protein [Acidimicrobiales bacterium]
MAVQLALPGPAGVISGVAGIASGVAGGGTGAAGAATGVAGNVAAGVAGAGVAGVFSAAGQWVASGAVWLLGQVGHAMSATTTVELDSGWFSAHLAVMASVAAAVVVPMACCAVLQALLRQDGSLLVRALLVQLPLALLLTGVAVELVQMSLAVTDNLSAQVLSRAGTDTTNLLSPVSSFLIGVGATTTPAVPAFVAFVGGLLVAVASLVLWLELVVRAAAVSVAVLFLPLALAAVVWPAVSHWCRRLVETLAALVLSKLVIAAALALAASALAGGFGVGSAGGDGGGFSAVVTGVALLLVATMAPFTLLRLVPAVEAGAVAHLETARHRMLSTARAPLHARNYALDVARGARPDNSASAAAPAPGPASASVLGTGSEAAGVGSTQPVLAMMGGGLVPPADAAGWGAAVLSGAGDGGTGGDHDHDRSGDLDRSEALGPTGAVGRSSGAGGSPGAGPPSPSSTGSSSSSEDPS